MAAALAAACAPADGVEVEPLPPLERPSTAARAGIPALEGTWRFAGWEVVSEEAAALVAGASPPGDLVLQVQQIDSVAGFLVRGDGAIAVAGEARRDGVVSLLAFSEGAEGRFAAGRVHDDTLWIELSTLPFGELSSPLVRWAFSRGTVGQAFLRLPTGQLLRDTLVALPDTATAPSPPPAAGAPAAGAPAAATPPTAPTDRDAPAEPPPAPPPAEEPPPTPPADTPRAQPPPPPPDSFRVIPPPEPRVDIPPG